MSRNRLNMISLRCVRYIIIEEVIIKFLFVILIDTKEMCISELLILHASARFSFNP